MTIQLKDFFDTIKEAEGLSIIGCKRIFNTYDSEHIPIILKDQEKDGSTFLYFSNGTIYGFYAYTENYTLNIEKLFPTKVPDSAIDISVNWFWSRVTGKKIIRIELLYGKSEIPLGILFSFENSINVELKYISESEHEFDALIIK